MKRIAQRLLVISLVTAASATFATTPSYPSSAEEQTPLSSEFPNIGTYADSHRNEAVDQQPMIYPSGGIEQMPLSAEFPTLQSYADLHNADASAVASTPTFPSSANETTSMAEEGLVPGLNGGTSVYAGIAQRTQN
jgi:hypothetical protein